MHSKILQNFLFRGKRGREIQKFHQFKTSIFSEKCNSPYSPSPSRIWHWISETPVLQYTSCKFHIMQAKESFDSDFAGTSHKLPTAAKMDEKYNNNFLHTPGSRGEIPLKNVFPRTNVSKIRFYISDRIAIRQLQTENTKLLTRLLFYATDFWFPSNEVLKNITNEEVQTWQKKSSKRESLDKNIVKKKLKRGNNFNSNKFGGCGKIVFFIINTNCSHQGQ